MIEKSKSPNDFAGQKIWTEELADYTTKVNDLIKTRIWNPVKAKADPFLNDNNYVKALEELNRFEDVYKYFRNDEKIERTTAGREHQEYVDRISKRQTEEFVLSRRTADIAFNDPKQRDESYNLLAAAEVGASAEQRGEIQRTRLDYLQRDVTSVLQTVGADGMKKALERIDVLKKGQQSNVGRSRCSTSWRRRSRTTRRTRRPGVVAGHDRLHWKLPARVRRRPSGGIGARKALFDIHFASSPQLQAMFLPASTDTSVLRAYLDPARATAGETRKILAMAEEGIKFTALRSSQYEAARELYVDLRNTALLEELLDQAGAGASIVSRDPGRFKTAFAPERGDLRQMVPRKSGEGPGSPSGRGRQSVIPSVEPEAVFAGGGHRLAREAVAGTTADPLFPLKAFYLFISPTARGGGLAGQAHDAESDRDRAVHRPLQGDDLGARGG
jgi:hypothetical protein